MRVAILGMGSIGKRHAANVKALGHEVIAYDPDIQVQEVIKADYLMCVTMRDVWAQKPEAVLVCSPPMSHYKLAVQAVQHSCHLFVEKPLDTVPGSQQNWRLLARECEELGLANMVACNWRYHVGPSKIVDWVRPWADDDAFPARRASFRHYSWLPEWVPKREWREHYTTSTECGGALWEVGWHFVDLALHLFGDAKLKSAVIKPARDLDLQCDGHARLVLSHDSGVRTQIEVDFQQQQAEATIVLQDNDGVQVSWHEGKGRRSARQRCDMYAEEMVIWVDTCRDPTVAQNPVSQAVKVLEILLKAREAGAA